MNALVLSFNKLTARFERWVRAKERRDLLEELDNIYETRKYFERRELSIVRRVKNIDLADCNRLFSAKVRRGW